jgi:stalled ribosome rescue protein Dom34
MLDEAAHRLDSLAPELGLIIVGGIPGVAAQLADRLRSFPRRVVTRVSLDVHASHASIVTAARSAACVLHGARDSAEIAELVELANDDLATVGEQATALALELGRVWTLYITPRYLQASENDAEVAVRSALDQHAEVVVVSSEAALHLDEIGGIAARARYRASATVERAPGAAIRPVSSST